MSSLSGSSNPFSTMLLSVVLMSAISMSVAGPRGRWGMGHGHIRTRLNDTSRRVFTPGFLLLGIFFATFGSHDLNLLLIRILLLVSCIVNVIRDARRDNPGSFILGSSSLEFP